MHVLPPKLRPAAARSAGLLVAASTLLVACGGPATDGTTPTAVEATSSSPVTPLAASAEAPKPDAPRGAVAPDVAELGKLLRAEGALKHLNARVIDEKCPEEIFAKRSGAGQVGPGALVEGEKKYGDLSGTSEEQSRTELVDMQKLVPEGRFLGIFKQVMGEQGYWTGICTHREVLFSGETYFERIKRKDGTIVDKGVPVAFLPKMVEAVQKVPAGTLRVALFYDDFVLTPLAVAEVKPGAGMRLVSEP